MFVLKEGAQPPRIVCTPVCLHYALVVKPPNVQHMENVYISASYHFFF